MEIPINELSIHPIKEMEVNGLTYYYIEKGEGPTVFLLHGFPDMANTWDETITALSGEFRCIAPFLRGYYPTAMPADSNYTSAIIAQDVDLIAQKLGITNYSVVGQDWGASVAYRMASQYPDKVDRLVTIAIPHPSLIKLTPVGIYRARHFLKFRNEAKSVAYTRKNDFAYIDVLFRRWSPGWVTYAETAAMVKRTYALPGRLEAALGYYWSFNKPAPEGNPRAVQKGLPTMPTLTMAGKKDGAITMKPFYKMEAAMTAPFELVVYPEAGHFLHREVAEDFIRRVREFLKTEF